ncbi:MAG: DUF4239 domain-containing protein [Methylocystaceae bacterium]|nr:DUF4239 domain-containing protein [Methylocystaceae bacterium]
MFESIVRFLYSIETTWVAVLFSGFFIGFAIVAAIVMQKAISNDRRRESNDIVGFVYAVIGVVYAVLIGAVAIGAWENFKKASETVVRENNIAANIYKLANNFDKADREKISDSMFGYMKLVIEEEWPQMQAGILPTTGAWVPLNNLISNLSSFNVESNKDSVLFSELVSQLDQLNNVRRERIFMSGESIHPSLYLMIIAGAFICIAGCLLFGGIQPYSHLPVTILLSFMIGLLLSTIFALDRPFRGGLAISAHPFELTYQLLQESKGKF